MESLDFSLGKVSLDNLPKFLSLNHKCSVFRRLTYFVEDLL